MFNFIEARTPLRSRIVAGLILLILLTTFLSNPFFFFLTAGTEEPEDLGAVGLDLAAFLAFIFFSKGAAFFVFLGSELFFAMFRLIIFPNSSMPSVSKPFKY